jgi:hypothetical protein
VPADALPSTVCAAGLTHIRHDSKSGILMTHSHISTRLACPAVGPTIGWPFFLVSHLLAWLFSDIYNVRVDFTLFLLVFF